MGKIESHVITCRNGREAAEALKKIFGEISSHVETGSQPECAEMDEPTMSKAQHAAKTARELYDALLDEGFTAEDAIRLACAFLT